MNRASEDLDDAALYALHAGGSRLDQLADRCGTSRELIRQRIVRYAEQRVAKMKANN